MFLVHINYLGRIDILKKEIRLWKKQHYCYNVYNIDQIKTVGNCTKSCYEQLLDYLGWSQDAVDESIEKLMK